MRQGHAGMYGGRSTRPRAAQEALKRAGMGTAACSKAVRLGLRPDEGMMQGLRQELTRACGGQSWVQPSALAAPPSAFVPGRAGAGAGQGRVLAPSNCWAAA